MPDINGIKAKLKTFAAKAVEETRHVAMKTVEFGKENKELCIAAIPIVVGLLKVTQSHMVSQREISERKYRERMLYDPSSRMYWDLRRKPSNADKAEICRRRDEGQDMYSILKQLRLI